MATKAQKMQVLFETNQIIALKMKRNRTKSRNRKAFFQNLIDTAERELTKKRNKYKIPLK